jgi:hypothetical protein
MNRERLGFSIIALVVVCIAAVTGVLSKSSKDDTVEKMREIGAL